MIYDTVTAYILCLCRSNASFSVGIPVSLGDEKRRDFPVQKTKQLEELVGLDLLTNKQSSEAINNVSCWD